MAGMEGQVALVTGGTRGIGAAVTRRLASRGVRVAACYTRDAESAKDLAASLPEAVVSLHQGDVADPQDCDRLVGEALEEHGSVDILVNNAGITRDRTVRKMDLEEWTSVLAVNLSGAFHLCRAVVGHMTERRYGRIVNVSSVIGEKGGLGQANYAAAKSGLFGLTKSLALETARHGITVNAVAPGFIRTDMVAAVPGDVLDGIIAQVPSGGWASPTRWPV